MENFKLVYKIGDLELELSGSQEYIDKERQLFLEKLPKLIELKPTQSTTSIKQKNDSTIKNHHITNEDSDLEYESIVQFLNSHDFPTKKETVLGMAYFVDCINKDHPVVTGKINALYDESRQKKPNTSEFLSSLVKSGDLMPITGNKNEYKLTQQGIELVKQRHK